jgi:hypothetical protein
MYGTGTTGGDQEVAKKTHLGFRPLADVVGPLRLRSSGALGILGLGVVTDHDLLMVGGFSFFFQTLCTIFFRMVRRQLHPEVKIQSPRPILALVVRPPSAEDAWSRVPVVSLGILPVLVLIGVVSG